MKSIPNILTILRLLACPILIYLFLFGTYLSILIIFMLACLTDFFDGYLAKKENLKSDFGKILDPIADKALIVTMCTMIIIVEYIGRVHEIALYIIILREIIITFLRFNLGYESKNIDVSRLSRYKTFIQMIAIGTIVIFMNTPPLTGFENALFHLLIIIFVWFATFVTLITGIQHFKTYLKLK